MNENRRVRRAPEAEDTPVTGEARHAQRRADGHDALEWRERDRERARLLLERVGDIARRIERACGNLADEAVTSGRRTAH